MRGYFAIGVEGVSKPGNLGNLMRSAHAFGSSFVFTVAPSIDTREMYLVDTSDAGANLPFYSYPDVASLVLPYDCTLIGVELLDDAIDLPSFRHPLRAAYVLGPERGSLSPEMVSLCRFVIKIPTRFCINVGVAGALVMYDRMICLGRHAERPVRVGGPTEIVPAHVHGPQKIRKRLRRRVSPVQS
ncbi:MAG: RNA methyltransferase [Rhodospirillaceae bacterium]